MKWRSAGAWICLVLVGLSGLANALFLISRSARLRNYGGLESFIWDYGFFATFVGTASLIVFATGLILMPKVEMSSHKPALLAVIVLTVVLTGVFVLDPFHWTATSIQVLPLTLLCAVHGLIVTTVALSGLVKSLGA